MLGIKQNFLFTKILVKFFFDSDIVFMEINSTYFINNIFLNPQIIV
jgi:hypothetical protein